jgi:hypothetical protein
VSPRLTSRSLRGKSLCGFCMTGHHQLCPGSVKNARPATPDGADRTWYCQCAQAGHPEATDLPAAPADESADESEDAADAGAATAETPVAPAQEALELELKESSRDS